MYLGAGFETASGVLHEIDIVARRPESTAIIEVKNRKSAPPTKNDVIVFFAKILDYLAANTALIDNDVCLVFVSSGPFEPTGLAACMGLGIHPVGPDIRPLPILVRNAIIMESEIRRGLRVPAETQERFDDMCARLNNLSSTLRDTWLDSRCGHVSEDKIVLKAVAPLRTIALAQEMWQLNADCADLLDHFRAAKSVK
ncbi:MAG: hypothetical protein OXQ31_14920 [Spirochaetaceae bacterium]|nr:hypothetical protein [Spirochaetaceae bacterium]